MSCSTSRHDASHHEQALEIRFSRDRCENHGHEIHYVHTPNDNPGATTPVQLDGDPATLTLTFLLVHTSMKVQTHSAGTHIG